MCPSTFKIRYSLFLTLLRDLLARFTLEVRNELRTLRQQVLAPAPAVLVADRVFAEQREGDRRITVGDRGVRQHARIDLAPADRLRGRCPGQSAPDDRVGGDLDEVVVAALEDAVDRKSTRLNSSH